MVRILQIGNLIPPHSTENHLKEAMEALGHQVAVLQEDDALRWESITNLVRTAANRDRLPEVVIWTRTKSLTERVPIELRRALCREMAEEGIPVFGVHLDRWWGLARESDLTSGDPYFSDLTILFTADGGHDDKWAGIGVNHKWFQPAVSHVEANRVGEFRQELCSPIAFVGSWQDYHPEWARRRELIEWLQRKYPNRLRLWPKLGQPGIRGQELCDLYESSCIVVGDSCLVPRRDGTPIKRYISDRVPETIGRGAFLLHPRVEGVTDGSSYAEGKHLDCYDSLDELDHKISHYLANDDERLRIARAGQEHVRANHLYIHRMREVLSHV